MRTCAMLILALCGCPSARSNDEDGSTIPTHADAAPDAAGSSDAAPPVDAGLVPDGGGPIPVSVQQGSFGTSLGEAKSTAHALLGRIPASGAVSTASGAMHRVRAWSGPIR
jgi:hypothetical protein